MRASLCDRPGVSVLGIGYTVLINAKWWPTDGQLSGSFCLEMRLNLFLDGPFHLPSSSQLIHKFPRYTNLRAVSRNNVVAHAHAISTAAEIRDGYVSFTSCKFPEESVQIFEEFRKFWISCKFKTVLSVE